MTDAEPRDAAEAGVILRKRLGGSCIVEADGPQVDLLRQGSMAIVTPVVDGWHWFEAPDGTASIYEYTTWDGIVRLAMRFAGLAEDSTAA